MISINNLTVAFGGFTLLDDISFHVSDGEHIALVGKNGAGKSTILKLIAGVERPTSGSIMKPKEQTVGYLPQIMSYSKDTTVLEAAMSVFADHFTMNERVEEISRELGERTDYESEAYHRLIEELNELNDKLAMAQSESPAVLAEKTLVGLGFKKGELGRQRSTFSQGWNMRVELAKVLLTRPDVLLLDEPTNHLDIESIQWLEDYLYGYRGSVVCGAAPREDGTAAGRLREPAADDREDRGVHRAFPLQAHQEQSGSVPHKGSRQARADRDRSGGQFGPACQVPAGSPLGTDRLSGQGPHRRLSAP